MLSSRSAQSFIVVEIICVKNICAVYDQSAKNLVMLWMMIKHLSRICEERNCVDPVPFGPETFLIDQGFSKWIFMNDKTLGEG